MRISTTLMTLLFVLKLSNSFAQSTRNNIEVADDIIWESKQIDAAEGFSIAKKSYLSHTNAEFIDTQHPTLAYYSRTFKVSENCTPIWHWKDQPSKSIDGSDIDKAGIEDDYKVIINIGKSRNDYYVDLNILPLRNRGTTLEALNKIEGFIELRPATLNASNRTLLNTMTSVLNDGSVYKFGINNTGVYKLTYEYLKNQLGISNIDNINPKKIKLYGNGGGMLPELNSTFRPDDLIENAIKVVGEEDGVFNQNDYILFYAVGADKASFDYTTKQFSQPKNIYSNTAYYFIKIDDNNYGQRIAQRNDINDTDAHSTDSFSEYWHYEVDSRNILHSTGLSSGSGKVWFGDIFNSEREKDYSAALPFNDVIIGDSARVILKFAARSSASSSVRLLCNNNQYSANMTAVTLIGESAITSSQASNGIIDAKFISNSSSPSLVIQYPDNGYDGDGFLDYLEVYARRPLSVIENNTLAFRDIKSLLYAKNKYQFRNDISNFEIWDVTNFNQPITQLITNNSFTVNSSSEILNQFITFQKDANTLPTPNVAVGKIENQNYHGIIDPNMVIIYHSLFKSEAERLAEHRRNFSGFTVELVDIDLLFNEFSSGALDPTAIRDFARMLYQRSDKFKFLLLVGDGSFDMRNILGIEGLATNYIPTYQTNESYNPVNAFTSDDYFGLLDDNEGNNLAGKIDIAIGRLPVKILGDGTNEATIVVDKIINYETAKSTFGDWRMRMSFVADDEDYNLHFNGAERITNKIGMFFKDANVDKIYSDAFDQVSSAGASRYPASNQKINTNMYKGQLLYNYFGHGSYRSWSQERILTFDDIAKWTNKDKLPLFITATCSFTGFDDPTRVSAGEACFLKQNGGTIGLFTTVRPVFASSNETLVQNVIDQQFFQPNGLQLPFGEVMRLSKNLSSDSRKFLLIGDPAVRLAFPINKVVTTKFNNIDIASGVIDTVRALQKVVVEGYVSDINGNILTDFNGTMYPTIFDKALTLVTKGQDEGSSVATFSLQQSVIFKGAATVTAGKFSFTCIIPKDINYQYGKGKISYYAFDGNSKDAGGYFDNFYIGGSDSTALADNKGPDLEIFMNDDKFVFGGLTNESPTLYVKLKDDSGISVVGNSVGHDLLGTLDDRTQNNYILNDFYQAAIDDYTKGEIRYPLYDLAEGRHHIKVKAWDVANNSGEVFTEFIVASSAEGALAHILNYPNPFVNHTEFQFEHNLAGNDVRLQIQIFTVSGKLVKTIDETLFANSNRITGINWDGKDDFGDQLAKGVYLYKIKLKPTSVTNQIAESKFEKLVILK
ncbi:MAG: type IX secretion system sortase PorU [Saprospiraceae bacterium]|nr:type IX secretion system sortase PorU [Saprospiraceae bacterium]